MIVYHVCTLKKLNKYLTSGFIKAPVRAWDNIEQAERMSISTGRRIILRLKFPNDSDRLEGHFNQARVVNTNFKFTGKLI